MVPIKVWGQYLVIILNCTLFILMASVCMLLSLPQLQSCLIKYCFKFNVQFHDLLFSPQSIKRPSTCLTLMEMEPSPLMRSRKSCVRLDDIPPMKRSKGCCLGLMWTVSTLQSPQGFLSLGTCSNWMKNLENHHRNFTEYLHYSWNHYSQMDSDGTVLSCLRMHVSLKFIALIIIVPQHLPQNSTYKWYTEFIHWLPSIMNGQTLWVGS